MVDLSQIKSVPITMFIGDIDQICPHATAEKYIPQIQSETTKIVLPHKGHTYFATRANSDDFMKQLVEQLQIPTSEKASIEQE